MTDQPKVSAEALTFVMSRKDALRYALLICKCGHRVNNHFNHSNGCAHCDCKKYEEIAAVGELTATQSAAAASKCGEWYAYYDDHRHEMRIQREPIIDSESGQYILVRRVDTQPSANAQRASFDPLQDEPHQEKT